jgi:Ribbon-helix-helix protein, copG family
MPCRCGRNIDAYYPEGDEPRMTRKPNPRATADPDVDQLADEAERGNDIEEILALRRGGRPPRGAAAGTVESVRLDPDLKCELLLRAARDHTSVSDVIRRAIGEYLRQLTHKRILKRDTEGRRPGANNIDACPCADVAGIPAPESAVPVIRAVKRERLALSAGSQLNIMHISLARDATRRWSPPMHWSSDVGRPA